MTDNEKKLIDANIRCSCMGYNLDKLIQPNILIILSKQDMHGYSIIQELEKRDIFYGERPDNTGVYRTLNKLEENGFVEFEWSLESTGPARKIYRLTDKGRECLVNWGDTLKNYRHAIDLMISDITQLI